MYGKPIKSDKNTVIVWAAATECYRLGASNNKHAFLTVLKAEKYKTKIPGGHMSDEDTLLVFLLYPHMAKSRGQSSLSCLFL